MKTSEVTIVYKTLPHYRTAFFDRLRGRLCQDGVRLRLIVGQPDATTALRHDTESLPWAEVVRSRHLTIGRRGAVWQPVLRTLRTSDLVIVEQASKLLLNYPLAVWRRLGGPRLALWGHGGNLDPNTAMAASEAVKRRLARSCDWWFCYTEGTAARVSSYGFPHDRMTVTQNATDTDLLRQSRAQMTAAAAASVRAELGLGDGPIGLWVSSIYKAKRPEFMVAAADELRQMDRSFELVVLGDGPLRDVIEHAASSRPWLHFLGARRGTEMATIASVASFILNPGLVGLTIVDGFAVGLPTITCDVPNHSPEIEYLEHEVNGLLFAAETTPEEYAIAVAELLAAPTRLAKLQAGAAESGNTYTLDAMVERFAAGIRAALRWTASV